MSINILFEGVSGAGKSTTSRAVASKLGTVMPTVWLEQQPDSWGLQCLYELLYYHRYDWKIDVTSWGYLRKVFYRQYLSHVVFPAQKDNDILILDGHDFQERGFPVNLVEGELEFHIDLYVVMLCDVSLIPDRLIARGCIDAYKKRKHGFRPGGCEQRKMDWYRNQAEMLPHLFSVDTTERTVDETVEVVLTELDRRFGWNVALRC